MRTTRQLRSGGYSRWRVYPRSRLIPAPGSPAPGSSRLIASGAGPDPDYFRTLKQPFRPLWCREPRGQVPFLRAFTRRAMDSLLEKRSGTTFCWRHRVPARDHRGHESSSSSSRPGTPVQLSRISPSELSLPFHPPQSSYCPSRVNVTCTVQIIPTVANPSRRSPGINWIPTMWTRDGL